MKRSSALLLYSCLTWSLAAEPPESRFGLVISALEDIVKNIEKQSQEEAAAFTEFKAWCDAECDGLSVGSQKAKVNSEKAFVQLRELTAKISALEHGIAAQQEDLKELKDAQDQMSSIREEEASKYTEEVDLNAQSARTVEKALTKISPKSSFLQRQSLEPDSGYVLGLLKGIQERLNQTRTELEQTEEAKRKTHNSLFKAKKEQSSLLREEVVEKTRLLQEAKVQLVEAQRIYDEEKESSGEMVRMQDETKSKCSAKTSEYALRQDDQKREKASITEAVSLLKQEEEGHAAGATFLQMTSIHKKRQLSDAEKKENLRDAVALMQEQTKEKAQGLGKAAEAVFSLVEAIRNHQMEDTKRKRFCELQMDGSEAEKSKLHSAVARLKARGDYLNSEVTSLGQEVADLKKEAAAYTDRLSQLEEVRSKESDSYQRSTRDRGLTEKVVLKAKSIVENFYGSKDPTTLLQQTPKTWALSSSRSHLGPSVVALLETIMDDFKKEQADADKAEQAAKDEIEKVRRDTKLLFDKKLEHISKLLQEKARDAEELTQVKADAELQSQSLRATEGALAKLGKDCTELLASYEKVTEEREKQVGQLQDVADILSGAGVGARTGLSAGLLELQSLEASPT